MTDYALAYNLWSMNTATLIRLIDYRIPTLIAATIGLIA